MLPPVNRNYKSVGDDVETFRKLWSAMEDRRGRLVRSESRSKK